MKKLLTIIATTLFSLASIHPMAAPVDEGPPAQIQKDTVPDTTKNGNYLEPQPLENQDVKQNDRKADTKNSKVKPKGKNVTNKPENGGVEVNPK